MRANSLRAAALLALAVGAYGCGDDGGGQGGASSSSTATSTTGATSSSTTSSSTSASSGAGGQTPIAVELHFEAKVGDAVFDCAQTYDHVGTADSSITISDFRLYVHDVRLLDASHAEVPVTLDQDGLWQHEDLALLDFEDKSGACSNGTVETNKSVKGTVPAGTYVGVAFKLGVPAAMNHLDQATAPSPLNLSAMFWAWTSGYKYLRVDTVPVGGAGPFLVHLGAGGCTGDPSLGEQVTCTNPNVPEFMFHNFDWQSQKLVVDVATALADNDLSIDAGGAPGCMSGVTDPECAPLFPHLGLVLATGMPDSSAQALVRVE